MHHECLPFVMFFVGTFENNLIRCIYTIIICNNCVVIVSSIPPMLNNNGVGINEFWL